MPALIPTEYFANVTWVGAVPASDGGLRSVVRDALTLGWDGPEGEKHSGRFRESCARVTSQYERGTEIANTRQLSVVCATELAAIASEMGLDAIRPEWLGATLMIEGIPDFSYVPPSARLQAEDGTCLIVDMNNRPCIFPAKEIEKDHPGIGPMFKPAAKGRRGVTAWVERPGTLKLGDVLRLHIPDQRGWAPALPLKS